VLFAKIRLTEPIKRAIPQQGCNNEWPAGTVFYVRQGTPEENMVVTGGPDAGLGIFPRCAEIIDTFETRAEMRQSIEAAQIASAMARIAPKDSTLRRDT